MHEQRTRFSSWLSRFSFRTRVSALSAAAVAVAIAIAAILSYFIVAHQLTSDANRSLNTDAASLQKGAELLPDGTITYPRRIVQQIELSDQDIIQFINSSGQVVPISSTGESTGDAGAPIASSSGTTPQIKPTAADRRVAAAAASDSTNESLHDTVIGNTTYRVLTVPLGRLVNPLDNGPSNGEGVAVQIGHSLEPTESTLADLRLVMTLVGLFGVALAIGLGLIVAGATIGPVKRLTAAAEHVAVTQDLEARIDEEGEDELARLGHAFNAMLSALAASRRQQTQLISDAGHELRTPLTSLRTNIEVLMKVRALPEADRAELLGDVRGQLDELTTLVGDLVDMARHEEVEAEPTEVRLDRLVERAVERARRRNSTLTFDVMLAIGSVRAQPALLERAVLNVLDNAAKFSPAGGTVEVTLDRGDRWYLDVRDHGPGIDPEDLVRVFDRFYRAPAARSLPGSGLGLAIVQQVISAHGGSVGAFLPPDGGTLVHIELPIVVEEEPAPDHADPHEPSTPEPNEVSRPAVGHPMPSAIPAAADR